MRLLSIKQLKPEKGITYHPQSIRRMIREGQFPKPVKLGDGLSAKVAFLEEEIDAWIQERIAKRDEINADTWQLIEA